MPRLNGVSLWRAIPLVDRYLWRELWLPFWWGVGAFSSIGVSAAVLFDLLRQVSDARLPIAIALMILGLQFPYFVSLSVPMAILLTCLLTCSRLRTDGELMALQAAGLKVGRLIRTNLCFALLAMLLMLALAEGLVPASQYQAQYLLTKTVQQGNFELQDRHILYKDYGPNQVLHRLFYAQGADGQTLYGLTVIDWTAPQGQQVIAAESATWSSVDNSWTFKNGSIYAVTSEGTDPYILKFAEQQLQLPRQPLPLISPETNPQAMTLALAQQTLTRLRQQGDLTAIRALEIQIHRKIALPFTVLVFSLVGTVLGISSRRLAMSNGFGLSLIFVLGQYMLIFVVDAGGRTGLLSPWLAAWLPNMIAIGLLGLGVRLRHQTSASILSVQGKR